MLLSLALALLLSVPSDTVRASVPTDTIQVSDDAPIRLKPVLPLGALFSGTFSVGLGAGVDVENLGWSGSEITATAFGSLYGYGGALTLASGDPYQEPVYGLLHGEVSRATRRRFSGVGPFSDEADRVLLDHTSATLDARLGLYPLGTTGLLVQPSARLLVDRLDALEPDTETALLQLDAPSQAAARALEGTTRRGLSLGLELASDRLDVHDYPSSGSYAAVEARRFVALDGSDLRFTRIASSVAGYVPVARETVVFGRAVGVVTRQDDDAVLPFIYLPTLDNELLLAYPADRFRGRDALAATLGLRAPVATVFGLFGLDAEITGTLGNVYTNVFEQFSPSVSFDASVPEAADAPLRPSAALALMLVNREARSMTLGGRIGVGPEGLSLALVSVTADLRDVVPLFR